MSDDEAAPLRACEAAPGDALVRLVYADWLDERGDPRGAYLRQESAACDVIVRTNSASTPDADWLESAGLKCDVVFESCRHDRKLAVIAAVRHVRGLGLADAVEVVEFAPRVVLSGVGLGRAVAARLQIEYGVWPSHGVSAQANSAVVSIRRAGTEPAGKHAIMTASSPGLPS